MNNAAIMVKDIVKRFGKKVAVDRVNFQVSTGCVCGLVGPNGAGKTTTIRMLLDLWRPNSGEIQVLGLDPKQDSLEIRRRIGYVPEKHNIYEWMRVRQVLDFTSSVYPRWDRQEFERINALFKLPMDRKVKELSRGELAKLALTIALSHKPELLILDEPTSGLDPLIRREFLEAIVGLLQSGDRTVFFSTHILSDVERVADRIIIMNEGTIAADDSLAGLRARFSKVSFLFEQVPPHDLAFPGARRVERGQREWIAIFEAKDEAEIRTIAKTIGATDFLIQPMTLEDIFVELVGQRGGAA